MYVKFSMNIDKNEKEDFERLNGRGQLGAWVRAEVRKYLRLMNNHGFIPCPKCGNDTHMRVMLNNGGHCQWDGCRFKIRKDKQKKPDIKTV